MTDNNEKNNINMSDSQTSDDQAVSNLEETDLTDDTEPPVEHYHSHGDSHHHSRHHRHHRHHRRHHHSRKGKFKKFFKKNRKVLIALLISLTVVLVIFAAVFTIVWLSRNEMNTPAGDGTEIEHTVSSVEVEIPFFTDEVPLVCDAIVDYMATDRTVPVKEFITPYREMLGYRLDYGMGVTLSYKLKGIPTGYSVLSATVDIAENDSFSNPRTYTLENNQHSLTVYYLKTNQQYYYKITLMISNGTTTSVQGSFVTADTPRILRIDGAVNVRDIGGWQTASGRRIKQGLLYRGSELDGAIEAEYKITDDGVYNMLSVLGVKTDIDLRSPHDNASGTDALGANVKHIYYGELGIPMYTGVFLEKNEAAMRELFSDLADPSHYPVYLHCTYGADRTGTICYLLGALLGMSEEDLKLEYEFSLFYHGYVSSEDLGRFIDQLKGYEGDTLREKTENYLLSIGVTAEEIQSIRDIFLS